MKRKPIHLDWDELEAAFENRNADLTYYLDVVTGQVGLEGEGEDAHFDDDELENAVDPSVASGREATRLTISSYSDDDELGWMDEFVAANDAIPEPLKDELGTLIAKEDGDGFREELRHHAEIRDRWFLFRSERVHEVMSAWLADNRLVLRSG